MQAFKALSYVDKWRVSRCLRRGEGLEDPRLAAAAVDLAEAYRREGRVQAAAMSWYPLVLLLFFTYLTISAVIRGDQWTLIPYALILPIGIASFWLDPRRRPENLARSLEASRQNLPAGWNLGSAERATEGDPAAAAGWYVEPDNCTVERLWDGEDWTSWVRPRSVGDRMVERDPAGWQPHPSKPGKELLWSGNGWTDRQREAS